MSRFKDLRVNRGYTQGKLAKELGISQQTISRIEFKDEMVPTDILIKASQYFNVSVDYILGLTDEKHNQVSQERMYQQFAKHEDLLVEYTALKPEYQIAVKSMIKALTELQESEQNKENR